MAKRPWGTPAQRAGLAKARQVSAARRKLRSAAKNRGHAPKRSNRGEGVAGLKKNTVPYVRVNKRSQTVGAAAGTIIPSTNKRVVLFGGVRIENTHKHGAVDKAMAAAWKVGAPKGTRRRKAGAFLKKHVALSVPGVRASVGGAEVRLGTSRGAGPTVIVRRGKHNVSPQASYKAMKRYDAHISKLHKDRKKPRPQRRKVNWTMG